MRLSTDSSRNVTSSNTPDAFGINSAASGSSSGYQWNGSAGYRTEGLSPTGMGSLYSFQKVGARYYDPTFGCFLTRDTFLSQKPYAYCNGDPVNDTDPTGHLSLEGIVGVLALGGGALGVLVGIHVALGIGEVTLGGAIIATGTAGLALTGGIIILGVIAIGALAWGTYEGTTKILDYFWPTPESG